MDPPIEDVVQHDVGEQRANARALRRTFRGLGPLLPFEHAGAEPSSDQPKNACVSDPMCQHPQQPLVVNRVKEAADVSVEDPVHILRHQGGMRGLQRPMRTPAGPETI